MKRIEDSSSKRSTYVGSNDFITIDDERGASPWLENNRSIISQETPMPCLVGFELHQQYEMAEKAKIASSEKRLQNTSGSVISEKEFLVAKQRYVESFADWLSHKAFCHDCKPKS